MKKMIAFVVVLAALAMGGYYGMGLLTERAFKKNLDVLNQSNGLSVTLDSYHRGWFKSTAMLSWQLVIPARTLQVNGKIMSEPQKVYTMQMPVKIYHGPFIFANSRLMLGLGYAYSHVDMPASYEPVFNSTFTAKSTKPSFDLSLYVSYLNNTSIEFNTPAFELIRKEGHTQFKWMGMRSETDISSDRHRVDGHLVIQGVSWVNETLEGLIKTVESHYEMRSSAGSGLYLGDADVTIPLILLTDNHQKILEVNQLSCATHNHVKKGLFNTSFSAGLKTLLFNKKQYQNCKLNLEIKNLDVSVLTAINDKVNTAQQPSSTDAQRLLFSILPDLPNLVNKGAQFEVSDLRVDLPNGHLKGRLLIAFPNENVTNPFLLVQKVNGNGNLVVSATILKDILKDTMKQKIAAAVQYHQTTAASPAAIVPPEIMAAHGNAVQPSDLDIDKQASMEVEQRIARMINVGLLSPKDQDYVVTFKFAKGQLFVNNQPFSPAMLQ